MSVSTSSSQPSLSSATGLLQLPGSGIAPIFQGATGPQGPLGPTGPAGPAGASIASAAVSNAYTPATDYVAASVAGQPAKVSLSTLLSGSTQSVFSLAAAAPGASTDSFPSIQGAALVAQTMAGIQTYIFSQFPSYKAPVIELTSTTSLDSSSHNGKILVASQPLTILGAAAFASIGSGFSCRIVNLSSGTVSFGSGLILFGGTTLAPNEVATVYGITYSGGSVTCIALPGSAVAAPITVSAPTTAAPSTVIAISGTVSPAGTAVQVALGSSATTAPTSGFVSATVTGVTYAASLTTSATAGTYYVWAQQTATPSAAVVSAAITVASSSVAITTVPSTGTSGIALSVAGTVQPSGDAVQIGLSTSASTPPTVFTAASVSGTSWTGSVTPPAGGTYYLWAEQTNATSVQSISGAITVSAVAGETLAVNTITAPAASTAFTVSGTYSGTPSPTELDYSTNSGSTWTALSSVTPSGGTYSFTLSAGLPAGTYTIQVRDHNNTSVTASSNSFTIAAPAQVSIASEGGSPSMTCSVPFAASAPSGTSGVALTMVFNSSSVPSGSTINLYFTSASPGSTEPTSGGQAGSLFNSGNEMAGWYFDYPSTPGTYYPSVWLDAGGTTQSYAIFTPITVT